MKKQSFTAEINKRLKIYDRLTRRNNVKPREQLGISRTIQGQDYTPQEIMRKFTSGERMPTQVYLEGNVFEYEKMDTLQRIDYLRSIQTNNLAMLSGIKNDLAKLQAKADAEKAAADLQKHNQQVIKEFKERTRDANDVTRD